MKKLINFILWPALAGLVFALTVLQVPRAVSLFPSLNAFYPPIVIQPAAPAQTFINSYSMAIKKAAPAVVSINSRQIRYRTELYQDDNPLVPSSLRNIINGATSLGSGVIISSDGYIITSYHILFPPGTNRADEKSTITLSDGRNLEARPVILDETNDLALIKIDAENLPYIGAAPNSYPEVGDVVLAIGNPRNIGQSVSMGIVSALLGKDDSYLIQTDAAINPGNSGGALIDLEGNLIGINSTIISESGGSEGIGLAIPAYKAIELLETYINSGPSGYLGVETEVLTVVDGLRRFNEVVQGLLINRIMENSPAANSGLRAGDIITAVNGTRLRVISENDLYVASALIANYGSGTTVTLELYREQALIELPVTLGVGEVVIFYEDENSQSALGD